MSYELFIKWSYQIYANFDLLNKLKFDKFCIISVNFEDTQMVDNILKISRPGIFEMCKLEYCNEKCRMD